MKRASQIVMIILTLFLAQIVRADLGGEIEAVLKDKLLAKAKVGVAITRLDAEKGMSIYRVNGELPLTPASNMKLLTSSAFLDRFGRDFKFRTLLVQRENDVILIGDGDPTFGDVEFLKKSNWTATTVFENWAKDLKKSGIGSFENVLVDDSIFDEVFVHPDWNPKQLNSDYSAEIAGMTLNRGCIDFTIVAGRAGQAATYSTMPRTKYVTVHNSCVSGGGTPSLTKQIETNVMRLTGGCAGTQQTSITIHDPAMYAATVLAETLSANGIKIKGKVGRDRTVRAKLLSKSGVDGYKLLAMHETPILTALTHANKESQNLYAESFCKRLGAAATGQSGSWGNGTTANANFLRKIGIDPKEFQLDDGCGLSHENTISADALVRILDYDFYGKNRDTYIATLPIGGEDGTLKKRFRNGLRGRVFAKTGFVEGASALSGYLKAKNDRWYAFSILMNGLPRLSNSRAKELQDSIVKAIDNNAGAAQ